MTKLALVHISKICSHWIMPPINIKDTQGSDNIHFHVNHFIGESLKLSLRYFDSSYNPTPFSLLNSTIFKSREWKLNNSDMNCDYHEEQFHMILANIENK